MFASIAYRPLAALIAAAACAAALMLSFAVPSPGAARPSHYRVRAGDSLWAIATAHYPATDPRSAVYTIRSANHLSGSTIVAGQQLVLP
jgi:LysM repeat protein